MSGGGSRLPIFGRTGFGADTVVGACGVLVTARVDVEGEAAAWPARVSAQRLGGNGWQKLPAALGIEQ
jgi:hypothetical protein